MPEPDFFFAPLLQPLQEAAIPYMVTGGAAAILYGEPRLTLDVDIVLFVSDMKAGELGRFFPEKEYYLPPPEIIREEIQRDSLGHFNIIHHATGLRADCYPAGKDPLNLWGMQNRRNTTVDGFEMAVACAEFVIIKKLVYYQEGRSEKHLRDIAAMLRISPGLIDEGEISRWCLDLGVTAEWNEAKGYLPPST